MRVDTMVVETDIRRLTDTILLGTDTISPGDEVRVEYRARTGSAA